MRRHSAADGRSTQQSGSAVALSRPWDWRPRRPPRLQDVLYQGERAVHPSRDRGGGLSYLSMSLSLVRDADPGDRPRGGTTPPSLARLILPMMGIARKAIPYRELRGTLLSRRLRLPIPPPPLSTLYVSATPWQRRLREQADRGGFPRPSSLEKLLLLLRLLLLLLATAPPTYQRSHGARRCRQSGVLFGGVFCYARPSCCGILRAMPRQSPSRSGLGTGRRSSAASFLLNEKDIVSCVLRDGVDTAEPSDLAST